MAFIKDEGKQLLLDRYLDIEWPDDVNDLRCVHCQQVAINHHMSNCQHLFCNNCSRVFSDGGQHRCPQCQEYVTQLDDQDLDVEVKINKMRIFCPNKKHGCKYEDQLRKIPTHLMTCVDTREAALLADNTRTDTMDTVVKQLTNMNATIGELKEGIKEVEDNVEEKLSQLERKPDEMDSKLNYSTKIIKEQSEDRRVEMESTPKTCTEDSMTKMPVLEPMHHRTMEGVHSAKKKSESTGTKVQVELAPVEEFRSIRSLLESMDHRIKHNESVVQEMVSDVREMRTKMDSLSKKMSKHNNKVNELSEESKGLKAAQNTMTERIEKTAERSKVTKAETKKTKSRLKSINQKVQHNESLLLQTTSDMEEIRFKISSMTQQHETVQYKKPEELNRLKAETYEWIITDVEKTISQAKWRFESEPFRFIGYRYDIKAQLEKKKSGIYIHLQFKDGDTINQFYNKYGFTGLEYIISGQNNIPVVKSIIREAHIRFDECFGCYRWILGYWLPDAVLSPPYMKDDCIKITMQFEPASIDRSFVSNNGVLMWTVDNYEARKQEQLYSYIWSPSFYTSPRGYRVKAQLAINYEQSMFIKVFFLTGEHDDSLSIDFHHKTAVTLFNQLDPSKNLSKSEQRDNVVIYNIQLERSKLIEESGFIKDDSILLKVVIEPVTSKLSTK